MSTVAGGDEEYSLDEASGEWVLASQRAAAAGSDDAPVEVRDGLGNVVADGDQVTLIKPDPVDRGRPGNRLLA